MHFKIGAGQARATQSTHDFNRFRKAREHGCGGHQITWRTVAQNQQGAHIVLRLHLVQLCLTDDR